MKAKKFSLYFEAVAKLEALIGKEKRDYMRSRARDKSFFLQRTQLLFDKLGNPERGFQYIHVTGTSGKGSTATMIHNILTDAGWHVGLYTSPHVTTTIERISINGKFVAPKNFAAAVSAVLPAVSAIRKKNPAMTPSYTDVVFAVAMKIFQKQRCAWVVVEVGCGGRYDHTNIIPPPRVAIITNVTREHLDILGPTFTDIAWQKAGVIKKGSRVFSAEKNPRVRRVLNAEAKKYTMRMHYVTARKQKSGMMGTHQRINGALASAAARALGIAEKYVVAGIVRTRLPARIEIMQEHPHIILDGAHAPAKIEVLATFLKTEPRFRNAPQRTVIFAPKEGKEVDALIAPLAPLFKNVIVTSWRLPGFQSAQPEKVAHRWQYAAPETTVTIIPDARFALQHACAQSTKSDAIIITGSLYLAGILRPCWISEQRILAARSAFPPLPLI